LPALGSTTLARLSLINILLPDNADMALNNQPTRLCLLKGRVVAFANRLGIYVKACSSLALLDGNVTAIDRSILTHSSESRLY